MGQYRINLEAVTRSAEASQTSEGEYFQAKAVNGYPLKPLGRPCYDCAVTFGLYTEISDALGLQPAEVIAAASVRWSCHNHPNRACRGNIDRIASSPEERRISDGALSRQGNLPPDDQILPQQDAEGAGDRT